MDSFESEEFVAPSFDHLAVDNDQEHSDNNNDPDDIVNNDNINEDIQKLRTAYMNELNSPEILKYDNDLIGDILEQIDNQQCFIDDQLSDPANRTNELYFANKLYQMEIDRLKYMVSSYLRSRLAKIEKCPVHVLKDVTIKSRLSDKEYEYSKRYLDMIEKHFGELAISKLPKEYQALDSTEMVPNLNTFVFCESCTDVGLVQCDDRGTEQINMQKNDRHVIRYVAVRSLVEDGQVHLI